MKSGQGGGEGEGMDQIDPTPQEKLPSKNPAVLGLTSTFDFSWEVWPYNFHVSQ